MKNHVTPGRDVQLAHGRISRLARRRVVAVLLGAAVAVLALLGAAQGADSRSQAADSTTTDQIRTVERERLRALVDADITAARRLHAPDFRLVNPAGAVFSLDDYLGGLQAGGIDFLAFRPVSAITLRASGDDAVIWYRCQVDIRLGPDRLTHGAWITTLYERRRGRWLAVREQATAIPNNPDLLIRALKRSS